MNNEPLPASIGTQRLHSLHGMKDACAVARTGLRRSSWVVTLDVLAISHTSHGAVQAKLCCLNS